MSSVTLASAARRRAVAFAAFLTFGTFLPGLASPGEPEVVGGKSQDLLYLEAAEALLSLQRCYLLEEQRLCSACREAFLVAVAKFGEFKSRADRGLHSSPYGVVPLEKAYADLTQGPEAPYVSHRCHTCFEDFVMGERMAEEMEAAVLKVDEALGCAPKVPESNLGSGNESSSGAVSAGGPCHALGCRALLEEALVPIRALDLKYNHQYCHDVRKKGLEVKIRLDRSKCPRLKSDGGDQGQNQYYVLGVVWGAWGFLLLLTYGGPFVYTRIISRRKFGQEKNVWIVIGNAEGPAGSTDGAMTTGNADSAALDDRQPAGSIRRRQRVGPRSEATVSERPEAELRPERSLGSDFSRNDSFSTLTGLREGSLPYDLQNQGSGVRPRVADDVGDPRPGAVASRALAEAEVHSSVNQESWHSIVEEILTSSRSRDTLGGPNNFNR